MIIAELVIMVTYIIFMVIDTINQKVMQLLFLDIHFDYSFIISRKNGLTLNINILSKYSVICYV